MRSQWTDKATGKVINLSNYAYSQMSGWNGYSYDWLTWKSDINTAGAVWTRNDHMVHISNIGTQPAWTIINKPSIERRPLRLRVNGMREGVKLIVRFDTTELLWATNGEYFIDGGGTEKGLYALAFIGYNANEDCDVTIEQLPYYPGALVSDGVDDKIQAEEALGEVGSVLIHWKNIGLPANHYLYNTGWDEDAGRLYCWNMQGTIDCGKPSMIMDGHPIMIYHRSPLVSTGSLSNNAGENNCPIFRLIFIKEQLDEYQQEFLMWKVGKEYRDWCKENGYEYAISEMLNN